MTAKTEQSHKKELKARQREEKKKQKIRKKNAVRRNKKLQKRVKRFGDRVEKALSFYAILVCLFLVTRETLTGRIGDAGKNGDR